MFHFVRGQFISLLEEREGKSMAQKPGMPGTREKEEEEEDGGRDSRGEKEHPRLRMRGQISKREKKV